MPPKFQTFPMAQVQVFLSSVPRLILKFSSDSLQRMDGKSKYLDFQINAYYTIPLQHGLKKSSFFKGFRFE